MSDGTKISWSDDLTAEAMREAYAMRRIGRHAAGRELDGRTWDEYPEVASSGAPRRPTDEDGAS